MTTEEKIIKNKLGLLHLAKQLGNIPQTCKIMGYGFYRFKELYDTVREEALKKISWRKPILKNRVAPNLEEAVVKMAFDQSAYGQLRVSNELRMHGLFISPGRHTLGVASPGPVNV